MTQNATTEMNIGKVLGWGIAKGGEDFRFWKWGGAALAKRLHLCLLPHVTDFLWAAHPPQPP